MKLRKYPVTAILIVVSILIFAQDAQQPKKIQRARRDVPCTVPAQVVGASLGEVRQVPKTDKPVETAKTVEKHTVEKEKVFEIRYVNSASHELTAHPVQALEFNAVPIPPGKSEIVTFGQTDLHAGGNIQVESGTPHPLELSEGQQVLAAGQQVKMGNYNSPQPAIMFRVVSAYGGSAEGGKTDSPLTVYYLNPYELAVRANGLDTGANPFFYWKTGGEFIEAKPAYLIRSEDSFTAILPYKADGTSPDLYIVGKRAYAATVALPKLETGKNEVKWNAGEKTQALIFDAKTNSYKVSDGSSETVEPLTAVQLQSNAKAELTVREVFYASITPSGTMFPNPMPFALNYSEPSAAGASWVAGTLPALGMMTGGLLLYRAIDALTGKDSGGGGSGGTGTSEPAPSLVAQPSSLAFSGNSPAPQSVQITSSKTASLDFTAATTAAWLSINPAHGRTPSGITVTANPAGLAPGIHTATINIISPSNLEVTPATVSVTLLVNQESTPNANPVSFLPPFINLAPQQNPGGGGGGQGVFDTRQTVQGVLEKEVGSVVFEPAKPLEFSARALCAFTCWCEDGAKNPDNGPNPPCECPAADCDKHKGPARGDWNLTIKGKQTGLHKFGNSYFEGKHVRLESVLFANGQKVFKSDGWTFQITSARIVTVGNPKIEYIKHGTRDIASKVIQDIEVRVSGTWRFDPTKCDGLPHTATSPINVKVSFLEYSVEYEEDKWVRWSGATPISEKRISLTYFSKQPTRKYEYATVDVAGRGSALKCEEKHWKKPPHNPMRPPDQPMNPPINPKVLEPGSKLYRPDGTFDKPVETITETLSGSPLIYVKVTGKQYTPPAGGVKLVQQDGTMIDTTSPVTLSSVAGVLVPVAGAATTYYFISAHDRKENPVAGDIPVIPVATLPPGGTLTGVNVTQPIATIAEPGNRIVAISESSTMKYRDGTPLKVDREFTEMGIVDGKSVYVSELGNPLKDGTKAVVIQQSADGTETKIGQVDGYIWVTEMNTLTAQKEAVQGQPVQATFKIQGTPPSEAQTVQVILDPNLKVTSQTGLQNTSIMTNAFGQTIIRGVVPAGVTRVSLNASAFGDGGIQLVPVYVP